MHTIGAQQTGAQQTEFSQAQEGVEEQGASGDSAHLLGLLRTSASSSTSGEGRLVVLPPALPVTACTRSGDWLSGFCSYTGVNSLCQINTILNFKITAGTPGITVIPIIVYPICLLELAKGVANICICVLHDSTAGERQELHVQRRARTHLEVAVLRAAAKQEPWHCGSHSALGCPVSVPLPDGDTWPCPGDPGAVLGNLVLPWGPTPSQLSSTGSSGTWPHSPPTPGAST